MAVNQKSALVYEKLTMPDGKAVAKFLSTGEMGPQSVYWLGLADGVYTLEVLPAEKDQRRGRYELRLEELRPATDADQTRWQAEMSCMFALGAEGRDKRAEAIDYYQKALAMFRQLHDRAREAAILARSAADRMDERQFPESAGEWQSAIAIFHDLGDRKHEAYALATLGVAQRYMSQFDDSVRTLEQSLAIRSAIKDNAGKAESLDRLGMSWSAQDRYDKAIEYYQQALALDRRIHAPPIEIARELNNLAVIYAFLNQSDEAIKLLEQALELARQAKDSEREAFTLNGIGAVYDNKKDYSTAVKYLEQALAIQSKLPDDFSGRQLTLDNLGSTCQRMGQFDKAIDYLEQAVQLSRTVKDRRTEGAALNLMGRAWRLKGQYDRAIGYYEQGRAVLRQIQSTKFEALSLSGLMLCWKAKGQPRVAIFYGKQSVNLLQSVRAGIVNLDRKLQESFLQGNEEPYRELTQLLISQQRLLEAEQVMDLMKVDEFRNFVRGTGDPAVDRRLPQTPTEAALAKQDATRSDRLMAIGVERGALMAKANLSPEERLRLESLNGELEEGIQKVQDFLAGLAQDAGAGAVDRTRLDQLKQAQGLMEDLHDLPPGTVAIYTLVTEEKYLAILITADAEKAYEYPIKAADLNRTILDFRQVLQNPNLDPRPLAQKLYGILLGKMAADLEQVKAQTLMWSLDGSLRYLPIAALYDGRRYLVEQYRVSVITPASNARLKDPPSPQWRVLGMGVTKEQKGAPALPEVATELNGIVAQGGMPGEIVLDEQFTETAMRTLLRKRFPVVHIASHFQFQPGDEGNSFLLLGDGGHFTLTQLKRQANLFSGVQLLTLSACSTGVSETDADGKEVEGFGALAQLEGARSVVASLWPVADVSTSLMMQKFYQARQSAPQATKLQALRDAQLALLHGELHGEEGKAAKRALIHEAPRPLAGPAAADAPKFQRDPKAPYAHPYYWAAFYLMGNWL